MSPMSPSPPTGIVVRQADMDLADAVIECYQRNKVAVYPVRLVLGIDLGLAACGYALVEVVGLKPALIRAGRITTKPHETIVDKNHAKRSTPVPRAKRIHTIAEEVARQAYYDRRWPDAVAIEGLFWYSVTAALDLARVGGAIEAWAAALGVEVVEYGVTDVRKRIAFGGRTDDRMVAIAVQKWLHLVEPLKTSEENDAAAVALRHVIELRGEIR